MSEPSKNVSKDKADKSEKRVSSHGDSPNERIPKDVSPEDAAWKDRNERNTTSDDDEERTDALLDEGSDLSFPASDPIAVSSPTKLVKGKDGKMHPDTPKPGNR